jgi:hypothetical protein
MKLIAKAIIEVMKTVKSIDKGMTVGTGNFSYKGVADKDVKFAIGQAMQDNGLCLIPTSVDQTVQVDRWQEEEYGKTKQKQSVFTEVKTKYLLLHESGESIEVAGYGQGVDSQDKSAGKATTYALKYTLLYLFMVATGSIDDADKTHSNEAQTAPKKESVKPWLNKGEKLDAAIDYLIKGGALATIESKYQLSTEIRKNLNETIKKLSK